MRYFRNQVLSEWLKIWEKCSHAPFARVWHPLICWPSKGVLIRCFLESGLNKCFTVCIFRNKVAMTIIFFFKMFKIDGDSINGTTKLFVFKIIGFELGTSNSHNLEQDTCHRQWMCYKTPLIFSESGCRRVMEKYEKSALMLLLQKFGTLYHVDCQRVFWDGVF